MSYRMHLVYCNTEDLEEVRSLEITPHEMCEGDKSDYFLPDMIGESEQEDFLPGNLEIFANIGQPLFHDALAQEYFSYYKPKVISQEEFLQVIDACRIRILNYYQSLLSDPKKCMAEISDKVDTWTAEYIPPYNLNSNLSRIVDSYDNDYQIWDLIRIYKNIDWAKHTVVLYGW